MTRKPDPAEIELQLSERRFILESLQTVAQLLQVPLVTAGVWFYISRTNPVMGALNKAILTAELAPIVGDIKFPEGVLLGAAMESTEDLLNLLEGYGLGSAAEWFNGAEEKAQDAGEIVAGQIVKFVAPHESCKNLREKAAISRQGLKDAKNNTDKVFWTLNLQFIEKLMKEKRCAEFGSQTV